MATEIIIRLKKENRLLKIVIIILIAILLLLSIQKSEGKQYEQLGNLQSQPYLWEQSW